MMEFEISLKALSVLRYITDCVDRWAAPLWAGAHKKGLRALARSLC